MNISKLIQLLDADVIEVSEYSSFYSLYAYTTSGPSLNLWFYPGLFWSRLTNENDSGTTVPATRKELRALYAAIRTRSYRQLRKHEQLKQEVTRNQLTTSEAMLDKLLAQHTSAVQVTK